ncbi:unnamed protein product [Aphanomyces euteiches]
MGIFDTGRADAAAANTADPSPPEDHENMSSTPNTTVSDYRQEGVCERVKDTIKPQNSPPTDQAGDPASRRVKTVVTRPKSEYLDKLIELASQEDASEEDLLEAISKATPVKIKRATTTM